jgi:hypothetical protein
MDLLASIVHYHCGETLTRSMIEKAGHVSMEDISPVIIGPWPSISWSETPRAPPSHCYGRDKSAYGSKETQTEKSR